MNPDFSYKNFDLIENSWTKYEGAFENNKRNGIGNLYIANGDKFFGCFKNDKLNG